jgi:chemotaxis methyl-accepting protein methylase
MLEMDEQASSIEELTASLEEISSQTKLNADNAGTANRLADEARTDAAQGNVHMKEMLKAMEEINESSSNISKIIKVIDDIAFQTNILALNAAVEAARAGQHGKGFAVVAEEVRNLAARSADAAKETTDLIEGSIKKTEDGTKIANDTANALAKIVDEVEKVAALVNDIANASNEQAAGINQINQGIMQVSDVVQNNSATSEESAAASEELSGHANLLKEMVGKYKLKQENVLPYLVHTVKNKDLRIWSAGCSSGEEPYTLAMIIDEFLGKDKVWWDTKILATDISSKVLEMAVDGSYSKDELENISPQWRLNYFKGIDDENLKVVDRIRNEVIFRRFNLMDETFPFKKKFHVIFCRNVMIYFDLETKRKLINKFYNLLEYGGYLFIGHSEAIERGATNFRYVMPAVYRKE